MLPPWASAILLLSANPIPLASVVNSSSKTLLKFSPRNASISYSNLNPFTVKSFEQASTTPGS
jgi:hypothetical protein